MVGEGEGHVQTTGAGPGPELVRGKYLRCVNGIGDPFGNGFLHEFSQAIQKRNGPIGFGGKIIGFARLGYDLDQGMLPEGGMEGMRQAAVKQGCHM